MQNIRKWCGRHPVQFMACYFVFYLSFFDYLESINSSHRLILHCLVDDFIPFCRFAIVPYFLWFPWIAFSLLFFLIKAPRQEFWRLCLPLFAGMTLSLLFCLLVPNGVALRPRFVPGQDIFAQAVRMLYRVDTSTNVCPSIHVFNSVTMTLAFLRSGMFSDQQHRWVRAVVHILNLSVILSTMLLKQHSFIDVSLGVLLALTVDLYATHAFAAYSVRRKQRRAVLHTR